MNQKAISYKKQILICDPNPDIRETIRSIVLEAFPSALTVESPTEVEAFRKAERQKFDLIVLDVKNSSLDGLGVIQAFREMDEKVRPKTILVVSSNIEASDLKHLEGYARFLPKPSSSDVLRKTITHLIQSVALQLKPSKMSVEFLNAFMKATVSVFATTAQLKITKEKVLVRQEEEISGEILAIMDLASSKYQGTFAVIFEKDCFLTVVEKMLGEKFIEVSPDISDAAGEICNQIVGLAKAELNSVGNDFKAQLPTVISQSEGYLSYPSLGGVVTVFFRTEGGQFRIEVCIEEMK